ncbi:acetoin utilization protein AcuC [Gracilibacillus alcaliphilus]|uniref:acetoin utilization protein AcuC n=1 Tax=Gracilibacillus alcaliphilus TaxID=1401441 RepID=UPI00195AE866|nr:acetoin utilization protein AcuC [Gracilibacillus alcaliphilus]MBM7679454.1 acetoin utilization protein AcuC [Gracilibacillus alcaliphilus]
MKSKNTAFIYTEDFLQYSFHEQHPFNQLRLLLTKELLESEQALTAEDIVLPKSYSEDLLLTIHAKEYIDIVKRASAEHPVSFESFGIGTTDTPSFPEMYDASFRTVTGSVTAAELVMSTQVNHALNIAGGLHHGFPDRASGFCIFNDIAIAIQYIREHYQAKVLYIDIDAHHGDGVQHCFYDDPNVCTVSIHETGRYLYPGTGKTGERGVKEGFGFAFNFPIDAFTEDDSFLETFSSIEEIAAYFKPDVIVSQHGADAHYLDPLTHLHCSLATFEEVPKRIHKLAHQYCQGKWVALGGGGYDIWRVVPRAWSQLWQIMNNRENFRGEISKKWLHKWQKQAPVPLPTTWEDQLEEYKPIPRHDEIVETNQRMTEQVMKFITNHKNE